MRNSPHEYGYDSRHDDGSRYEPYHPPLDEVTEPYEPSYRRRWSPRRPVALVTAALVAFALLLVGVDRAVAARIESRTAKAFQQGMGTPRAPEVHVRGFPVLTQAASGPLDRVDITAHDIPAHGTSRPLKVSELALRLEGLTKSDDDSEARARRARATAFLSYPDVSDSLGLEIAQGDRPGRVSAVVLLPFGRQVTVTTTVSAVSGNRIAFKDFEVTGGALPAAGNAVLDKVFQQPIQLRNIPDGLRLRSITTTAYGLRAHFSGSSVTFRPDGASRKAESATGARAAALG
ncbi:DUF2993 domain-containing protein [Streptomyces sp. NPDC098781]|uniref:LmeA family phospholipid-binding protein n=1 Tax=Streptomyces sp. NPDC098781 TaxID=3366097 RepID=UPI0038155A62